MHNKTKLFRILYIIGYTLTAIMLTLTIIFRNYTFYFTHADLSTLKINIPITCLLFGASTIFLILILLSNKQKQINAKTSKKKKSNKTIKINKNTIIKIITISLYTLSALLVFADIILINYPIINVLIIPLEITLAILSLTLLIVATKISNSLKFKQLIQTMQNINREN